MFDLLKESLIYSDNKDGSRTIGMCRVNALLKVGTSGVDSGQNNRDVATPVHRGQAIGADR